MKVKWEPTMTPDEEAVWVRVQTEGVPDYSRSERIRQYILAHPTARDRDIAVGFGVSRQLVHKNRWILRWRRGADV